MPSTHSLFTARTSQGARSQLVGVALSLLLAPGADAFVGGDGSPADPYQVSTCEQLQSLADDLTAHYILVNDVDCSTTVGWNGGAGFDPIGSPYSDLGDSSGTAFRGSLDGDGHVVTDLFINRPTQDAVGLFGHLFHASVHSLGVVDATVIGENQVGPLAGVYNDQFLYRTLVFEVFATGRVESNRSAGGLVGRLYDAVLADSYSRAVVSSCTGDAGGLAGTASFSEIHRSHATGTVRGGSRAGGLIAASSTSSFRPLRLLDCFAGGRVLGPSTGGLIAAIGGFPTPFFDVKSSSVFDWCDDDATDCVAAPLTTCPTAATLPQYFDDADAPVSAWDFVDTWGFPNGLAGAAPPCLLWENGCESPSGMAPATTGPVAECRDLTLVIGPGETATLRPSHVDAGSFDPLARPLSLSLTPNVFTTADAGSNPVTLTVSNLTGDPDDTAQCSAQVTVVTSDGPAGGPCAPCGGPCLGFDFDGLDAGTVVAGQFAGITISGSAPVMSFDTASPTCGDDDLATPGLGPGNDTARGDVLILAELGSGCAPDDERDGGLMTFVYDEPQELDWVGLLDIDEPGTVVRAYSGCGSLLAEVAVQAQAVDNGWQQVTIGRCGVTTVEVELAGSGAVTDLACTSEGRRGRVEPPSRTVPRRPSLLSRQTLRRQGPLPVPGR
ncbi:MAG: hypothetical protein AAF533_00230 [Acidobacteriota bacterium]